jgi:hypothetical protein
MQSFPTLRLFRNGRSFSFPEGRSLTPESMLYVRAPHTALV